MKDAKSAGANNHTITITIPLEGGKPQASKTCSPEKQRPGQGRQPEQSLEVRNLKNEGGEQRKADLEVPKPRKEVQSQTPDNAEPLIATGMMTSGLG